MNRIRPQQLVVWAAVLWIGYELLWYEQYKLTGNAGSIEGVFQPLANWFGIPAHEKPIRLTVASMEIAAALLTLVPASRILGALLALGIMSGAIFFHTIGPIGIDPYGDGGVLFKEACFTWAMALLILLLEHARLRRLLDQLHGRRLSTSVP